MAGGKVKLFTQEEKRKMEQMAFDQSQDKTIAAVLGCDVKTLKKSFSTVLHKKRCEGKIALRRAQMQQAQSIPTMSIFLGKNYLDQKDSKDVKVQGDIKLQIVDYANTRKKVQ
jgi:hypothetical protein